MNLINRTLKKKLIPAPLPTIESVEYTGNLYKEDYAKTLFYYLYLTGQRISEALATRHMDITIDNIEERDYIIIDSLTEKNRSQKRRKIPIPLFGLEKEMAAKVWLFIQSKPLNEPIFSIKRIDAWRILRKVEIENIGYDNKGNTHEYILKLYPHFLRHCRASHMASFHNYDIIKLMAMFGWSSPAVPSVYVSMNWRSLAEPMKEL